MKTSAITFRIAYIVFIIIGIVTVIIAQLIIRHDLNNQNKDAKIINRAGRERMLSQRIAKLSFYIQHDVENKRPVDVAKIDTLKSLSSQFNQLYLSLPPLTPTIDSLLVYHKVYLEKITFATSEIIHYPTSFAVIDAVNIIRHNEIPFLLGMERIVSEYQKESERKLEYLKKAEIVLGIITVSILGICFVLIFLPVVRGLEEKNNKLAELTNSLEQKEKLYRGLVESSQDMIYEVNDKGFFQYINPMLEKVSCYSKEELYTKHYSELIHEDYRKDALAFYKQQLSQKKRSSYYEFPFVTKTNETVWVALNTNIISTTDGSWKGHVVARDITKLREVQQKLEESEKLYRLLLENSTDVVALHDPDGTFKYISPSAKSMLGYNEEELIGTMAIDLAHPEDRPMIIEAQQQDIKSGVPRKNLVFRLRHKMGHYVWGEVGAKPIFNELGKVEFILTDNRDITDRKLVEQKLIENEMLFRSLADNAPVGIFRTDPQGNCTYVNNRWCEIAGLTSEQAMGDGWMVALHKEDAPKVVEEWIASVNENREFSLEYRFEGSGETYWVVGGASKYEDSNGNILGYIGTISNITKQKENEYAIEHARRKAEQATRAKAEFLSMMSHEIRTPLNGIIGMANILGLDNPKPEQIEMIRLLKFSGENLLTIINDILDFNKMEAGKVRLEKIPFDMQHLIQDTLSILDTRCKEKGIVLNYYYNALPKIVMGDPVRLNQIINNLVTNAIKFTEHGFVEIRVESEQIFALAHKISIRIKDSGIGIAENNLIKIFDGFTQAADDITRKFGGTGLGLSISKRLANLMGGDIFVTSIVGTGSVFTLSVPMSEGKMQPKKGLSPITFSQGLTVLLVEDNKGNQVVASIFLKKKGLIVTIANDGIEAVEMVKQKSFDLILMDLQMPLMNGYDAAEAIRSMDDLYFKTVPIIALTSNLLSDVEDKVKKSGMNGCMTKPFKAEELLATIASHIHKG
jgi:PAS domain S-box-containing protein